MTMLLIQPHFIRTRLGDLPRLPCTKSKGLFVFRFAHGAMCILERQTALDFFFLTLNISAESGESDGQFGRTLWTRGGRRPYGCRRSEDWSCGISTRIS